MAVVVGDMILVQYRLRVLRTQEEEEAVVRIRELFIMAVQAAQV